MIRDRDRIYGALVTNPSLLQASFSAPRPMFISWRRPGTLLDTAEMILVLSGYMLTFAAKLGFAFHYEVNGTPLPTGGGAQVMWFSNLHERTDPREIFSLLPAPLTLQQGRKTARRAISILVRPRRTRTHVVLCFVQSVLCCCRRDSHRPIWLKANADKSRYSHQAILVGLGNQRDGGQFHSSSDQATARLKMSQVSLCDSLSQLALWAWADFRHQLLYLLFVVGLDCLPQLSQVFFTKPRLLMCSS